MDYIESIDDFPKRILFTHYGDNWLRGSEICLINLLENIDRKKFTPIIWCNSRAMEVALISRGFLVYRSDFTIILGWESPKTDITSHNKLVEFGLNLVESHNISLLHSNSGAPTQWLSRISKKSKVPLVTHLHCRYQLRDRITLRFSAADKIVGVSDNVLEPLAHLGSKRSRLCVIPNGINTSALDAQPDINLRRELNIEESSFVIITTGSLIKRKGIDIIINMIPCLIKAKVPVKLLIIGSGEEELALKRQIKSLSLENDVHLLGERENVIGILRATADIFVSAARDEAFGLVLVEAGLAGLPVIAPNIGGIPSVISHEENGILIDPDKSSCLYSSIISLYNNPLQRYKLGLTGRKFALERFNVKNYAKSFEKLYDTTILEYKPPSAPNIIKYILSKKYLSILKNISKPHFKIHLETKK